MDVKADNFDEGNESNTLSNNENNERSLILWTALHSKEEPNAWVINSGCSNHMISDRRKLTNLKMWNGGLVSFVVKRLLKFVVKEP